jgi:hypothetical protein
VLITVVPSYAQKRVKLRKKEADYSCYFLVLNQSDTQEAAISCKSCHFSCISSVLSSVLLHIFTARVLTFV